MKKKYRIIQKGDRFWIKKRFLILRIIPIWHYFDTRDNQGTQYVRSFDSIEEAENEIKKSINDRSSKIVKECSF